MVEIGIGIGVVLIIIDEILRYQGSRFRAHVMPVAVGIYLPLGLSVPILIGGVINQITRHIARPRGNEAATVHRGVLFGSGLIAGEAIMGIIAAFLIVGGISLPLFTWQSTLLSIGLFVIAIIALIYVALRRETNGRLQA
jgi:uncharacterized oligopeptide transporter (OPT) family protein